jgi:hypothetical protein
MTDSQTSQSRALRLLKRIYDRTRDRTEPVFVAELAPDAGLTEEESQAAWHYLKDKGFIQTFNLPYTARISAAGIHAIEDARHNPDHPSQAFPSITYNIVNVRTAINCPIQQAGAQSMQEQVVTYSAQELSDLARLVGEFANHFDELKLDTRTKQRAKAQLDTLEAQLSAEPDPVVVRQVGQTLRNITEGAIGSLVAAAAQPTIWSWVAHTMAKLFS